MNARRVAVHAALSAWLVVVATTPRVHARGRHDGGEEREARVVESRTMLGDAAYGFRGAARARHAADDAPRTPTGFVVFAAEAHGMLPLVAHRLGPAIAADLELGAAPPFAFAYGVHLHPVGVGLALGTRGSFIATGGIGFGGVTAAQRPDLELPIGARVAIDIDDRVRMAIHAQAFFTPDARDHLRATVGDETRVGIGVRVGHAWTEWQMSDAGGYFFRFERVERLGTAYVGLFVGYELGGAF